MMYLEQSYSVQHCLSANYSEYHKSGKKEQVLNLIVDHMDLVWGHNHPATVIFGIHLGFPGHLDILLV